MQAVSSGSALKRAWHWFLSLHSEIATTQLEWAEGLRAAVGITIPAAVGLLADHLVWGILCSFATLWILMCDVGGAYRQKAINLVASAVTILCAFVFGGWMIQSATNYIIGTFLWVSLAALIGVAGNAAAQVGLVSSTIVVTSVVLFVPSEFAIRSVLCVIGFFWALALSLALWPVRPFSPLFRALSDSCVKLADLAGALVGRRNSQAASRQLGVCCRLRWIHDQSGALPQHLGRGTGAQGWTDIAQHATARSDRTAR
jgi:hypothetical protein